MLWLKGLLIAALCYAVYWLIKVADEFLEFGDEDD